VSKEFYDKYGKLVDCFSCNCIDPCSKSDIPLCSEGYVFFAKDKIADLEAKLAVADDCADRYWKQLGIVEEENTKLKQQLAEKEKEIEWLKEEKSMADNAYKILTKKLKEKEDDFGYINKISKELGLQNFDYEKQIAILKSSEKCLVENLKKADQDKISFCIEKLEKVKELLFEKAIEITGTSVDTVRLYSINEIFNNQIKQLKEMK
jgi:hypothetical protein